MSLTKRIAEKYTVSASNYGTPYPKLDKIFDDIGDWSDFGYYANRLAAAVDRASKKETEEELLEFARKAILKLKEVANLANNL